MSQTETDSADSTTVADAITDTKIADEFADPDADLVIVTDDRVHFHVHRWILSRASGFFNTMLSLKQPEGGQSGPGQLDRIQVPEDSAIINLLLLFIYPVPSPQIDHLEQLSSLLDVAVKYDVLCAINALRTLMLQPKFLRAPHPAALALYSIAVRYSFPEVASEALQHAISRPLLSNDTVPWQLRFITGEDYHHILRSQRARADAAREVVAHSDLQSGNMLAWMCGTCNAHGCSWWKTYKDVAWRSLADEPTSRSLWNKTIIEQCLFRGCEKRYFYFGRAVELGYFESLKKAIDCLPWDLYS